MSNMKKHHYYAGILLVAMFLTAITFRSLLLNITTHLLDWNDYPYYVWTIFQQVGHISRGQFFEIGNANIYHPHQGVMFFSDLLLPQSIIATFFSLFSANHILVFNLMFFTTFVLNAISSIFLWSRLTENKSALLFATIVTVFSPFIFLQLGHIQMISIWPFLFATGLLIQQHNLSLSRTLYIGILHAVLFLTSVYLAVFFVVVLLVWYGVEVLQRWNANKNRTTPIFHAVTSLVIFAFLIAPFLWQYISIQNSYEITRSYGEYVFYAAHITDYIFQPYQSVLSTTVFKNWNSFNLHNAGELAGWPSFSVIILAIIGMVYLRRVKSTLQLSIPFTPKTQFFLLLTIIGFVFSLGPRLNVNGYFANIPMPYIAVLKLFPLAEPVRATSRWSFLFYLGLTYFSILGIERLDKRKISKASQLLIPALTILFLLEIVPMNKQTEAKEYYSPDLYSYVEEQCEENEKVLLEYPINRNVEGQKIEEYLTYKTQHMLASLHHECTLVNGYSGFTPKETEQFETSLDYALRSQDEGEISRLLEQKDVTIIKLNKAAQNASESARTFQSFSDQPEFEIISSDEASVIYARIEE